MEILRAYIENMVQVHGKLVISPAMAESVKSELGEEWFEKNCTVNQRLPIGDK